MPETKLTAKQILDGIEDTIRADYKEGTIQYYGALSGRLSHHLETMINDPDLALQFLNQRYDTPTNTPVVDSAADQGRP